MTLNITSLDHNGVGANTLTTVVTASVSPAGGTLLLLWIGDAKTGGLTVSSVAGNTGLSTLTFAAVTGGTVTVSSSTHGALWSAPVPAGFSGSGTITITFSGSSSATEAYDLWQVADTAQAVAPLIVASNTRTATATTTTALTMTFNAAAASGSVFAVGDVAAANITETQTAGWAEPTDAAYTSPSCSLETSYSPNSASTSVSITPSLTASRGAIGVELTPAPLPLPVQVPVLVPLGSAAARPLVITAPPAGGPVAVGLTDTGAGADVLAVTVTSSIPVVLADPPSLPLASVAAPARVILGQVVPAALADTGTAAGTLAVTATNMPVVVTAPVLTPLLSPGARPQVIEFPPQAVTPVNLADSGTGTDSLSAAVTNMPVLLQGLPTLPLPFRAQQPQVILGQVVPVALADTGTGTDTLAVSATVPLADTGTGTDSLTAAVASNIPVVVTAPVLTPLLSPARPPLVVTGPAATIQAIPLADTGTAADTLTAATASNIPLVVPVPPSLPWNAPAAPARVIPGLPFTIALADAGTGTDSLAVTSTVPLTDTGTGTGTLGVAASNIPLTVPVLVLRPLTAPAGAPQVITGPPAFVPAFSIGTLTAADKPTATQAPAGNPTNTLTAVTAPSGGTLTAADVRTGGPG